MARFQGAKEKLHMPIYDAFFVPGDGERNSFERSMTDPRVIRFFQDIQNKTKLETNLQASGVLPSLNTFEARALRVVIAAPQTIDSPLSPLTLQGDFLSELIYNSITSLLVGEKIMIEMPTYWFPAGAGVHPGNGFVINHGEPDPMATFRFAEPVYIEPQQNFRVEMQFPRDVPAVVKKASGPLRIWVVLDGYLTRDVQ